MATASTSEPPIASGTHVGIRSQLRATSCSAVVANDVTRDDMIKVAANVEVTGEPDLAWLGQGAGA